ncbi:hypothetical protein D3C71_1923440 [compost metagenome]
MRHSKIWHSHSAVVAGFRGKRYPSSLGTTAKALLLSTTVFCGLANGIVPTLAQDTRRAVTGEAATTNGTVLQTITVQGDSATGPDQGIVAKRSRSASKTDTAIIETP